MKARAHSSPPAVPPQAWVSPRRPRAKPVLAVAKPVVSGSKWFGWDDLSPVTEEVEAEPPLTEPSEIDVMRDSKIMSERMLRSLDDCPP